MLGAVLERGAMLDEARVAGAAPERAEARRLADLTLRRLGQVDEALGRLVARPPEGRGRNLLRLMAAELLFAGTPAHAAVDVAVRLAKAARATAGLAGLVNAVGRRLAREGPALIAGQDAARLNTPEWLWQAMAADWGEGRARAIAAAHLAVPPLDLTAADPERAGALAAALGAELLPTGSLRLAGRPRISGLAGFGEGRWWVQDAAAALPARLIPAPAGRRVLDLCAAPGGKTMQLAAAGARVTAVDVSSERMQRLAENLVRTGLAAEQVVADALAWTPGEAFDAVLLDVPCSATGTIRRHPDVARRHASLDLAALTALQRRLLARAAGWVRPGGVLVYCACSLLRAEGEALVADFLAADGRFRRVPVAPGEAGIPAAFMTPEGDLRTLPDLWPDRGGLDGFFAARLERIA